MPFLIIDGEMQNTGLYDWAPVGFAGVPVAAVQLSDLFVIDHDGQRLYGQAGDYLVQTDDGRLLPIPRLLFHELFAVLAPRLKEITEYGDD